MRVSNDSVKVNSLKIYFYVWAALVIVTIWLDRWIATLSFGIVSSLLGAIAATTHIEPDHPKRKKYKQLGVLMILIGTFMSLLMIIDGFILGYSSW